MHDFCFTLPYGALMILGGLIGYLAKGSTQSLYGGLGSGLLLCLAGYGQLKAYEKRANSILSTFLQIIVAMVLAGVMGKRFLETQKFFPPGLVSLISFLMVVYYVMKASDGGNRFKKASSKVS